LLISNNLYYSASSTEIIPAMSADHAAIVIEIGKLDNEVNGAEYWKMNCALL